MARAPIVLGLVQCVTIPVRSVMEVRVRVAWQEVHASDWIGPVRGTAPCALTEARFVLEAHARVAVLTIVAPD